MSEGAFGFGPFDEPMTMKPTEYGGKEGLVQSAADGHEPTASEKLGMANRTRGGDASGVDPHTGMPVPVD